MLADPFWEGSEGTHAERLLSLCLSQTNLGLLRSVALTLFFISLEGLIKFNYILSTVPVLRGILYFWFVITRNCSQI